MGFFPLLNRKEDIWKFFGNQTIDVAIDFYSFFSILWKSMATVSCSQCNLVLWCKAKFFSIITPVLSVTWSFRNHSHVLNRCSRNISSSHQCLTPFIFLIHVFFFFWWPWNFFFRILWWIESSNEQHLFKISAVKRTLIASKRKVFAEQNYRRNTFGVSFGVCLWTVWFGTRTVPPLMWIHVNIFKIYAVCMCVSYIYIINIHSTLTYIL